MIKELVDKLNTGFLPDLDISIKLGLIFGILILICFFVCWAIASACKIAKYRKTLIGDIKKLNDVGDIKIENAGVVYETLKNHPEEVKDGWSDFLDQRVGFPSNYMPASKVLSKREFSGKNTVGKVLFGIVGIILVALSGVIGFLSELTDGKVSATEILVAIQFILIPVAFYIICLLLLNVVYSKQIVRLEKAYKSFVEILDERVVIEDREEKEFNSESLDEISQKVAELLRNKEENNEVIEVITIPTAEKVEELPEEFEEPAEEKVEEPVEETVKEPEETVEETVEEVKQEEPEVEPEPELEPEPEPIVEEEPVPVAESKKLENMTEDEQDDFFFGIIDIVADACFDESLTQDDYFELAEYLDYRAQETGAYDDPGAKEIIELCFDKLAQMVTFDD
ncbi:MAG: hypothetical protein K5765_03130 [Clostridia bacterium]|nr:hypothetical protein [Clostridia bacterium]